MDQKNESFISFSKMNGQLYDDSKSKYPIRVHALYGENNYYLKPGSTYFIYVQSGIVYHNSEFPIKPKMYACATEGYLTTDNGAVVLIVERIGQKGMTMYGGPIEAQGRLKYIDGCTDSLLIPPVKYGDACLNHLHFPVRINQTMHTHPSLRVGIVTKGNGLCRTPFGNIELKEGIIFVILPEERDTTGPKKQRTYKAMPGLDGVFHAVGTHCFQTFDEEMDVIAFHPESDYGPRDEEHPMINRTIVDGISAKNIDSIRTK